MYYFIYPFIYKKINNRFYYLNEIKNELIETQIMHKFFDTKMSLFVFMECDIYILKEAIIEKNKLMINEYFEYFIKEHTNE